MLNRIKNIFKKTAENVVKVAKVAAAFIIGFIAVEVFVRLMAIVLVVATLVYVTQQVYNFLF